MQPSSSTRDAKGPKPSKFSPVVPSSSPSERTQTDQNSVPSFLLHLLAKGRIASEKSPRCSNFQGMRKLSSSLRLDFNAKLSDFCLAKDGHMGGQTHVSTRVMGTYGYVAPEYVMTEVRLRLNLDVSFASDSLPVPAPAPAPIESLSDMCLHQGIMKDIAYHEYTRPTSIQAQAMPIALSGRDLLGCAETGSGKTAVFTIPMIEHCFWLNLQFISWVEGFEFEATVNSRVAYNSVCFSDYAPYTVNSEFCNLTCGITFQELDVEAPQKDHSPPYIEEPFDMELEPPPRKICQGGRPMLKRCNS
ncbi:hypothetical protein K1719_025845 [Acacia pycnantha]|nr:hypothetical protein K1719_025845 [Acacia pycnantha]